MTPPDADKRGRWLWVWVGGAFLLMFGAWAVLFVVTSKNHIEEVPVTTHAPH